MSNTQYTIHMNFKASNYHFNSSRILTHQGHQLFKDFNNNSSRTTSTLQGLHHSSLQSRTSTHQGHRLFKDINTTTRTTSLHCSHPNIIMATVQEYDDILRYKMSTSNKYRSGLSKNDIRDKASRWVLPQQATLCIIYSIRHHLKSNNYTYMQVRC